MQRISTDINNVQRKEQEIQAKKIKDEKQLQEGNKYPVHITQEEFENGGTHQFFFRLH